MPRPDGTKANTKETPEGFERVASQKRKKRKKENQKAQDGRRSSLDLHWALIDVTRGQFLLRHLIDKERILETPQLTVLRGISHRGLAV